MAICHSAEPRPRQARRRVSGRRPRAKFHVHQLVSAGDRIHLRHPSPEHAPAPHVQVAVRAFLRSRGLSVEVVVASAPRRPRLCVDGDRARQCVSASQTGFVSV
jgi:hypothetical protein